MKFAIAMVTFNRLVCLQKALECYESQSYKPAFIVVVNNCSTDGTKEFLDKWKDRSSEISKIVITCDSNLGGSGGFYKALEEAQILDCDFIFMADDDAYADPDMLKSLNSYYEHSKKREKISALCTKNINKGKIDTMHRRRVNRGLFNITQKWVPETEYLKRAFPIDELSFVGAAVKTSIIREIGLPKQEYFIYYDDTEYSARIRSKGQIVCVSGSVMYHDSPAPDGSFSWKTYYIIRNELDNIKSHYPRRYFKFAVANHYIKKVSVFSLLKHRTIAQREMCKEAIDDAIKGNLGKNPKYSPSKAKE